MLILGYNLDIDDKYMIYRYIFELKAKTSFIT